MDEKNINWPPNGIHLKLYFKAPKAVVIVNYEMFDNVPFVSKWLTVQAKKKLKFRIDIVEQLSLNWQWSQQGYDWLQIVPDQPHGAKIKWITEVRRGLPKAKAFSRRLWLQWPKFYGRNLA